MPCEEIRDRPPRFLVGTASLVQLAGRGRERDSTEQGESMAAWSLLILMVTHCCFVLRLTRLAFGLRVAPDCHYYQYACDTVI